MSAPALPQSLAQLVDALGMADAFIVVEKLGGARIYLPSAGPLTADHYLVKALDPALAERLRAAFPGEELELPKAAGYLRQLRDADIRADRTSTLNQLALKHRLTRRQIISIRAGVDPDTGQGSLL